MVLEKRSCSALMIQPPEFNSSLTALIQSRFRLSSFRKGQQGIVESIIQNHDTLAVMPTGGGKSLCYQLAGVYFEKLTVVVSPLIALMKDQVRSLNNLGIPAGALYSGQTQDEKREIFRRINESKTFILYLSPERVQNEGFAKWIKTRDVGLFAIDEAHCVSQWGPEFRQDYHKLKILRELMPKVPIMALTATATPLVLRDVATQLGLRTPDRHVHGFYRPNLYYQIEDCADENAKMDLVDQAIRANPSGRILIYCGTRQQTEDLSSYLSKHFEGTGFYHAGMSTEARTETQRQIQEGDIRILAATNAFGMGIDYPDVRLVIHFQIPSSVEALYQEMGRAGRDGANSTCLVLYARKDKGLHSFFIQQSQAENAVIQRRWNALNAVTQFLESAECRHSGILTYFKDSNRVPKCGHCDVCDPSSPRRVLVPVKAKARATTKTRKRKTNSKKGETSFELEDEMAKDRAEVIKVWRRKYAAELDKPAFIIFSDRTLRDLANKNPQTLSELHNVFGLGEAKIELFGELLLNELRT